MTILSKIKSFFLEEEKEETKKEGVKLSKPQPSKETKQKIQILPLNQKSTKKRYFAIHTDSEFHIESNSRELYKINEGRIKELMNGEMELTDDKKLILGYIRERLTTSNKEKQKLIKETGLDNIKVEYMVSKIDECFNKVREELIESKNGNYEIKKSRPKIKLSRKIFNSMVNRVVQQLHQVYGDDTHEEITKQGGILESNLINIYIALKKEDEEVILGDISELQTESYEKFLDSLMAGGFVKEIRITDTKARIIVVTDKFKKEVSKR